MRGPVESLLAAMVVCVLPLTQSAAETMNNATILSLSKAGLGDGLIIDKLNTEPCGYDVSTKGIVLLKQAGVSDNVISAMVRRCATLSSVKGVAGDDSSNDPKIRHSPGIYVAETWLSSSPLQVLKPSKPSGMRTAGNGSIVFPLVTHMMIPGSKGRISIPISSPTFYFYFNLSDNHVSDFGTAEAGAAQSPDEFSLVKFKRRGDDREMELGKISAYGSAIVAVRQGIDTKFAVPIDIEDMGNGIYSARVKGALEPGEYAFVLTGTGLAARIYDFSIAASDVSAAAAK
ncbi:MAG: hypothetical protein ACR2F8_09310 [Caulobacteraceae bacterium]